MKKLSSLILALITVPILHAQVVEVDLTGKDLFVREDGTGDGSSWAKAMGPQTFAYYLPQAKDGTTFHVAEGTYYPMYDSYLRTATGSSAVFTVNSDITIKGGYPANPESGAVSDPTKYKAVFSGDFDKDDEFKVALDESNNYYLDVKNYKDNCTDLFLVRPSVKNNWTNSNVTPVFDETDDENYFRMEGVSLTGGSSSILLCAGKNLELNLSYSTFANSTGYGIYMVPENPSFIADNCKFSNVNSEIEFITPKKVAISNSVFDGCGTLMVLNQSKSEDFVSKIQLDNNRFKRTTYSNGTIELTGLCDLVVKKTSFSDMKMISKLVWGSAATIEFDNCKVRGVRADAELFYTTKSTKFKNCTFEDNESRIFLDIAQSQTESFEISNCLFKSNAFSFSFFQPGMKAAIKNNTFMYNTCESYFMWNHSGSFEFTNNSVIENTSKYQGFSITNPNFYNNTILGNEFDGGILEFGPYFDDETSTCNLYGNIILGNATVKSDIGYNNLPVIKSDKINIYNNLMPIIRSDYQEEGEKDNTTWVPNNSTNIFVRPFDLGTDESSLCKACSSANSKFESDVLSQLYSGKYGSKSHVFEADLDENGDLPVARLKTSRLEDGSSLLFPLKNTIVTKDQLGTDRTVYTSMGSVEKSCVSDTTLATESIVVGSSFEGKKYTTIGSNNIKVTKKNIYGCDSVVNYTLNVLPDPKIKEFYVKTKKAGKGDGSDWDNAMDPKTFAFVFANSETEGVTYYVAAGTYKPVYNYLGKETNDKGSSWRSNVGANIYGGYDPAATGDASTTKADPAKYRTIFSGDLKDDDKVKYTDDCTDNFENFTDNVTTSMLVMSPQSDVHISGIELTGMNYSRGSSPSIIYIGGEGEGINVTIDYCKIYVADKGISVFSVDNFVVDNCEFSNIRNAAVGTGSQCKVSNSTFTYTGGVNLYGENGNVSVENSTFVNNAVDISVSNNDNKYPVRADITNNTFISCSSGSYFNIYDNVTAYVKGNVFAGVNINHTQSSYDAKEHSYISNLMACKKFDATESFVTSKDNIILKDPTELYTGILDGKYSATDGVFTANLKNNGGYTRTVALLKDKLSNDDVIRFDREKNIDKDQRGVSRLAQTSMGAYEIDKESLAIDPAITYYYVKTKKAGKGDGSDWDNAMDPKTFAYVFANSATEGVTYYVAAGTYRPVYNYSGVETNDKASCWKSKVGANIFGGYDPAATGNASTTKADPAKYRTIFSGDLNEDDKVKYTDDCTDAFENFTDNTTTSMLVMSTQSDVHISGIELTGMNYSRGTSPSIAYIDGKGEGINVTIDYCKIYVADKGISVYSVDSFVVDNCEFSNILNAAVGTGSPCRVSNSTFTYTGGVNYYGENGNVNVENSTFVNNTTDVNVSNNGNKYSVRADVTNCTFISCSSGSYFTIYDNVTAYVKGNIFAGVEINHAKSGYDAKEHSYISNLMACKKFDATESFVTSKDNIILKDPTELYTGILDGKYSADGIFTSNLKNNGGYTSTVALLKDKLSNGTVIRFDRVKNIDKDQRGVSRLAKTCMGAYEIDKESFSIDPTIKDYYVKTTGGDDVDGTSWESAMDPETFAEILPLVGDGVTIHVAEGEYTPTYNSKGEVPENSSELCFTINNDVTIIGGYPAEPKKGDVSNPDKYKTIFSGDIKHDDKYGVASTESICLSLNFENRKDNSSTLFLLNESATNVNFKGVTVKSATNGVVMLGKQTLNATKSTFSHCGTAIQDAGAASVVNVSDSKFMYNLDACVNAPSAKAVNVSFTSFSSNTNNLVFASDSAVVTLDSVDVFNNKAKFYIVSKAEIHASRSQMYDNCDDYVVYLNSATTAENTFVETKFSRNSGKVIVNYAEKLKADSCEFTANKGNCVELINKGNANIAHSKFNENKDIVVKGGSPVVSASSFVNNTCENVLNILSLNMSNSTITGNKVETLIYQDLTGEEMVLTNNTIISNNASNMPMHANSSCKVNLYGNIILDNADSRALRADRQYGNGTLSEFYNIGEVKYNLMDIVRKNPQTENTDMSTYVPDNNTNILVMPFSIANISQSDYLYCAACAKATGKTPAAYLTALFNGTYDQTTESFSPVVNSSDYITELIPLKSNNGILFPLSETTVTADQRGAKRQSSTCMGSYEMACISDTSFVVDTIIAGAKFNGVVYTKVGRQDSVLETKPNKEGCDDIVCYTLYVMPDPKVLNYYVKTKATGKGDGSDWDNAMDGSDFASYLPLVADGVTFYVAEGTYIQN